MVADSNTILYLMLASMAILGIMVFFRAYRKVSLMLSGRDAFAVAIIFFALGFLTEGLLVDDGRAFLLAIIVIILSVLWIIYRTFTLARSRKKAHIAPGGDQ